MKTSVEVKQEANRFLKEARDAKVALETSLAALKSLEGRMVELVKQQQYTVEALQALKDVRPILAASSIEKAVGLANNALQVIFGTQEVVRYVEEDMRFVVDTPLGETDLVAANGGGYLAVVSFIFTLFLILKTNSRRFLAMDEQFTMISDEALENFIIFLRKLCKDLGIDVMLITHDARIEVESVDAAYLIENGMSKKIK